METFMDYLIPWFVVLVLVISFIALGVITYNAFFAETIAISKDSFACTKSHEEQSIFLQSVGSVMVPMTTFYTICDQYTRK